MSLWGRLLVGSGLFVGGLETGEGVAVPVGVLAGGQGLTTVAWMPFLDVLFAVEDGLLVPPTVAVPVPELVEELVPAFVEVVPLVPVLSVLVPLGLVVLSHGPTIVGETPGLVVCGGAPATVPGLPATLPALPVTAGLPGLMEGVPWVTLGLP